MDLIALYHETIAGFVAWADAPRALLQVHFGMAIYLGCLLAMGTRRGSLAAVFVVVGLALLHELMNRIHFGAWSPQVATRNLLVTMFWPTACYAVSWFRRWHWAERERQRGNDRLLHLYDYRPRAHGS